MKLKDVSFFQQHVEKFVLAGAVVFALLVASYFLLGSPYSVNVSGESGSLTPAAVEKSILDRADQLEIRLQKSQDGDDQIKDPEVPPYAQDFEQRWNRELLDGAQLPGPLSIPGLDPKDVVGRIGDLPPYYVSRPPVGERFIARAGTGMIDFSSLSANHDKFVELIGSNTSADIRYVSVGTEFDFGAWIERLMAEPPSEEYRPLRRGWVLPTAAITGVYLQRQRLDPATGEWGETTIVEPLPNQVAFLGTENTTWNPDVAKDAVEYIRQHQEQIARPEFVPLAAQNIWMAPDTPALMPEQQTQLNSINRDIHTIQKRIEILESQFGRSQNQPGSTDGGNQGGAARRTPYRSAQSADNQDMSQRLETARHELREKLAERNVIWGVSPDMLSTRGSAADPSLKGFADPNSPNQRAPRTAARLQPRLGNQPPIRTEPQAATASRRIRVWAHDLTVKPGQTYRYRVVVTAYNPLFQLARVSTAQREQYYHLIALAPDEKELAAAPWSQPVSVDPQHHFFLVGGSTRQQLAQVEVWQLFHGKWRSHEFTAQPGDPLGGIATITTPAGNVELDMRIDSLLVDLVDVGGEGRFAVGGTTRMLFLNRDTNLMADRDMNVDRSHPDRIRLQNEAAMVEALVQQ